MTQMTNEQANNFVNQIDFCYGNVEWSQKIHEKSADTYTIICNWKNWTELILSFLVGCDVLSQIKADVPAISYMLMVSSALLAFIETLAKSFNFEKRRDSHISTANSLWEIRESYRSFKTDIAAGLYSIESYIQKRDELQKITSETYKKAPRTFNRAYNKAKKDFETGKVNFEHLAEK